MIDTRMLYSNQAQGDITQQDDMDERRFEYYEKQRVEYRSLTLAQKIEMLDEAANGMGWYYATNKEREIECQQLLKQEAMRHYIQYLKHRATA